MLLLVAVYGATCGAILAWWTTRSSSTLQSAARIVVVSAHRGHETVDFGVAAEASFDMKADARLVLAHPGSDTMSAAPRHSEKSTTADAAIDPYQYSNEYYPDGRNVYGNMLFLTSSSTAAPTQPSLLAEIPFQDPPMSHSQNMSWIVLSTTPPAGTIPTTTSMKTASTTTSSTLWPTVAAYEPEVEGPVLVIQDEYWHMIVSGEKNLEIRHQLLKPKKHWAGHKGRIFGTITLGAGFVVESDEHWRSLVARHRVDTPTRWFRTRCCALPVVSVEVFDRELRYLRRKGQETNAKYRPVPQDWPVDKVMDKAEYLRRFASAPKKDQDRIVVKDKESEVDTEQPARKRLRSELSSIVRPQVKCTEAWFPHHEWKCASRGRSMSITRLLPCRRIGNVGKGETALNSHRQTDRLCEGTELFIRWIRRTLKRMLWISPPWSAGPWTK